MSSIAQVEREADRPQERARGLSFSRVRPERVYVTVAIGLFLGLSFRFISMIGDAIVDDAFITLIYARNLAEGSGLVWTDGVRIEGYTDSLWVLLGAAAFKVDFDPILAYRIAGIASGVALLAGVWYWTERYSLAPAPARIAPLILAMMGPVAYWAVGGLESTAFASLCFLGTLAAVTGGRSSFLAGGLFFLGFLAHPDAIVLFAPVFVYKALEARGSGNWKETLFFGVTFFVPAAVYWVLRWIYFGEFVPNTAHAKSTFSLIHLWQAFLYVQAFAPLVVFAVAYIIGRAWLKKLRFWPTSNLLLGQLVLWLAYLAYVGGDFMVQWRFLVPILPMVAILLQDSAWQVVSAARWRKAALTGSVLTILVFTTFWLSTLNYVEARTYFTSGWKDLGLWLGANTQPHEVIAVTAAGAIPYFAERPAIDMLGLNDRHIARHGHIDHSAAVAHKRHDAPYVLSRRPEFIVINNVEEHGQPVEGAHLTVGNVELMPLVTNEALFREPAFWQEYTRVAIAELPAHHVLFVRNDRAAELIASGAVTRVNVGPQGAFE